jgi:hypothetical protein
MNDDNFKLMIEELDEQIGNFILKYKIDPLSYCGMFLARMGIMMNALDGKNDYCQLLSDVRERIMEDSKDEKVIH